MTLNHAIVSLPMRCRVRLASATHLIQPANRLALVRCDLDPWMHNRRDLVSLRGGEVCLGSTQRVKRRLFFVTANHSD